MIMIIKRGRINKYHEKVRSITSSKLGALKCFSYTPLFRFKALHMTPDFVNMNVVNIAHDDIVTNKYKQLNTLQPKGLYTI